MSLTGKAKQNMLLKGSINRLKVIYTDAYELAVKNGFEGTLDEWLAAIKGEPGDTPYIKDGTWWIGEENTGVAATEPGPQGEQGIQGEPGPAGDDYTLTEADKQEIAELAAGMVDVPEGGSGADGFSPIATVTPTDDGAVISITDKSGTTTATINHGTDGQPGKDGADGASASLSIKYARSASNSTEPTAWQASIPTLTPTYKYLWAQFTKMQGLSASVWSGVVGVYGDTGPTGPTGPQGEPGPAGPQGIPGDAYVLTEADKQTIAALAAGLVEVPEGSSGEICDLLIDVTTTERVGTVTQTIDSVAYKQIFVAVENVMGHADDNTKGLSLRTNVINTDNVTATIHFPFNVNQSQTTAQYGKMWIFLTEKTCTGGAHKNIGNLNNVASAPSMGPWYFHTWNTNVLKSIAVTVPENTMEIGARLRVWGVRA